MVYAASHARVSVILDGDKEGVGDVDERRVAAVRDEALHLPLQLQIIQRSHHGGAVDAPGAQGVEHHPVADGAVHDLLDAARIGRGVLHAGDGADEEGDAVDGADRQIALLPRPHHLTPRLKYAGRENAIVMKFSLVVVPETQTWGAVSANTSFFNGFEIGVRALNEQERERPLLWNNHDVFLRLFHAEATIEIMHCAHKKDLFEGTFSGHPECPEAFSSHLIAGFAPDDPHGERPLVEVHERPNQMRLEAPTNPLRREGAVRVPPYSVLVLRKQVERNVHVND